MFSVMVVLASSAAAADEQGNRQLPKCTKVEVLQLDLRKQTDTAAELKQGGGTERVYEIPSDGSWCRILQTKVLEGEKAEALAQLWRGLAPEAPPATPVPMATPPPKPGEGTSRTATMSRVAGLFKCHQPPFAYRFYAGDRLLAESSVCWRCQNFTLQSAGEWIRHSFDPKAKPAVALRELSERLFSPSSK